MFLFFLLSLPLSFSLFGAMIVIFVNLENESKKILCDTPLESSSSELNDRHFAGHFFFFFAFRSYLRHFRHFIVRIHRYEASVLCNGFLMRLRTLQLTLRWMQFLLWRNEKTRKEHTARQDKLISISVESRFDVHWCVHQSTHSHHNFNYIPLAFAAYSYSDQHRLALLPAETPSPRFHSRRTRNRTIPPFTHDIMNYIRRICRNKKGKTTNGLFALFMMEIIVYDIGILSFVPRRNCRNIRHSRITEVGFRESQKQWFRFSRILDF